MDEPIVQIVITRVEEPVDTPRSEVFKISLFSRTECVDTFHSGDLDGAVELVAAYLEDLRSV